MASKISGTFKEEFIESRTRHDSVSQAIRLGKLHGLDEKQIQTLVVMKQQLADGMRKDTQKIVKSMTLSDNIVALSGGWYGVRYTNDKGEISLKLDILNESDLSFLRRDGRVEQELTQKAVHQLIPGCINEAQLEIYKQLLLVRAREILHDYAGLQIEDTEATSSTDGECTVSSHAGMRWVQRMLRIGVHNEAVAEEYRRTHIREIEESVRSGYGTSEKIWYNDAEGITFKLDADNIVYVVGNNNVITLYEADFGFTKEINRMILFSQLEVLRQSSEELQRAQSKQVKESEEIERKITATSDEIGIHEATIQQLKARKSKLVSEREQSIKDVSVCTAEYEREFNKLFKKWKP
jgi:hypothetical protein